MSSIGELTFSLDLQLPVADLQEVMTFMKASSTLIVSRACTHEHKTKKLFLIFSLASGPFKFPSLGTLVRRILCSGWHGSSLAFLPSAVAFVALVLIDNAISNRFDFAYGSLKYAPLSVIRVDFTRQEACCTLNTYIDIGRLLWSRYSPLRLIAWPPCCSCEGGRNV